MNFLSPGLILGLLTLISAVANAFGKPALGSFLSDPSTAQSVQVVIDGGMALVAGVLNGIKKPA